MSSVEAGETIRDLMWREIGAVTEEIRTYPAEKLWWTPAGVSNPAGVLAQHLIGNLNHFIGHGLGKTGYVRERDREFAERSRTKEELVAMLEETRAMVSSILGSLTPEELGAPYPITAPIESSTLGFLIYLYHHLSYHHGQINYLRRIGEHNAW